MAAGRLRPDLTKLCKYGIVCEYLTYLSFGWEKPLEQQLHKKYGLMTATAMVVGTVIGSGVFFKAEAILTKTGGDMGTGILAWGIGGLIMMICACTFSIMATKYSYVNGVVDYAEVTVGPRYGYLIAWFMTTIYYPAMTSVLAWVSARYLCVLLGFSITGAECLCLSCLFLVCSYAVNALSPRIAGKIQVSTTVIKLIPLLLMAVVGTIAGLRSGVMLENFTTQLTTEQISETFAAAGKTYVPSGSILLASVVASAFAYEGWIITTCINAELRDAKKNLPRALVMGTLVVACVYILYYIGLNGGIDKLHLMVSGEAGAQEAFTQVFSSVGGTLLGVFIVISCLGTLNGLMLGATRGMYALAVRGRGPRPEIFRQVDAATNMPTNSAIAGLVLCALWLTYFFGANLTGPSWFGPVTFDSSELPIITIYAMYLPIFVMFMWREKELSIGRRFIMPAAAMICSLFMVYAAAMAHGVSAAWYLLVYVCIMAVGICFMREKKTA